MWPVEKSIEDGLQPHAIQSEQTSPTRNKQPTTALRTIDEDIRN